jgi:hypothetical protein
MKTLVSIALLALPIFADSIPAGWIVIKEKTNTCQVAVPADFKADQYMSSLAKGPGDAMEVQIFSSTTPVKPLGETVAKAMGIDKFFDNTVQRVFYAEKSTTGKDGKKLTGYKSRVPRTGGSCWTNIVLTPAGSEDLMKKIAATVGPSK